MSDVLDDPDNAQPCQLSGFLIRKLPVSPALELHAPPMGSLTSASGISAAKKHHVDRHRDKSESRLAIARLATYASGDAPAH